MALYDLHEKQQQIVREMVTIFRETGVAEFDHVTFYGQEHDVSFHCKPKRKTRASHADLRVLHSEGLIDLNIERSNGIAWVATGMIRRSAVEAVELNFEKPAPQTGGVYQTFYAPVGAVHTGTGNISDVKQSVGMAAKEVAQLISGIRGMIDTLPPETKGEAADHLSDLESELQSQVPKQSRIKSSLMALWLVVNKAATFGMLLAKLAKAYGLDPTKLFGDGTR